MKKILVLSGAVIGVLFAVWDTLVDSAETAAPDGEGHIPVFSIPFLWVKMFTYLLIGGIAGALAGFLLPGKSGRKK